MNGLPLDIALSGRKATNMVASKKGRSESDADGDTDPAKLAHVPELRTDRLLSDGVFTPRASATNNDTVIVHNIAKEKK